MKTKTNQHCEQIAETKITMTQKKIKTSVLQLIQRTFYPACTDFVTVMIFKIKVSLLGRQINRIYTLKLFPKLEKRYNKMQKYRRIFFPETGSNWAMKRINFQN